MKKLYEILGQRLKQGDIGVEIEMEGRRFPDEVDPRWVATVDGSLRGENREFVFAQPLPIGEVQPALEALTKNLKDANTKIEFSFRTSVHIHLNCQDLTVPQYLNLLYTYFLLEEPLMNFCGKERKGNRFCLRLQDAEGMMETFNHMFRAEKDIDVFQYIPPNQVRYSAMNIEATTKFGSVEFRGMAGNLDIDRITTWATALTYLREFAKSVDDPTKVYDMYADLEAEGFMEHVLKDLAPRFYYIRCYREMQRSFSLSLDLPFAYGERIRQQKAMKDARAAAKGRLNVGGAIEGNALNLGEFIQAQQANGAPVRPARRVIFGDGIEAVPAPAPRRPRDEW